jgi:KUP system potassium uptake protein
MRSGWSGFAVLGGVFLAITGGEALYADMGHIGRKPIRTTWYGIVLPSLLLNYAGQTALVLDHRGVGEGNPFFRLAPEWAIFPLVVLSSVATIIASQAIITGAFSLTRQAMQLGWFPGLHIRQTSADEYGQIYVPFVNWAMMLFTIVLIIGFGSSVRLAGAYGAAVSNTMVLTTALLYSVMRAQWNWPVFLALLTSGFFLIVDLAFFAANMLKIADGGWIPLTLAVVLFLVMTTWHAGIDALRMRSATMSESPEQFLERLQHKQIPRVPAAAVFLTRQIDGTPLLMIEHLAQLGALPQLLIALTVKFEEFPRVLSPDRLTLVQIVDSYWHVTLHYGFVEVPDLPAAMRQIKEFVGRVDLDKVVYFVERDEIVPAKTQPILSRWRLRLFAFLYRNSVRASDLFNLPPSNFIQMGREIEI